MTFLVLAATAASPAAHAQATDPDRRRAPARQEAIAMASRVQERQALLDARNATRYAENRQRCATALRVAKLCGKHAGTFFCDARGFQPIPEAQRAQAVPLDNPGRYAMDQCARRVARDGP